MIKTDKPVLRVCEGVDLKALANEDPLALIQITRNIERERQALPTAEELKQMWSVATIDQYLNFGKPHESVQTERSLQRHFDKRNMLHYFSSQLGCSTMGEVFHHIESRQVPATMMLFWAKQGLFLNKYWHSPVDTGYPECSEIVTNYVAKFIEEGTAKYGGPIGLVIQAAKDILKSENQPRTPKFD